MNEVTTTSDHLTDLAAEIRGVHGEVKAAARATVAYAYRVGELLLEAKKLVRHGD